MKNIQKNTDFSKQIIANIFSFLFSVLLTLLTLCLIFKFTFLNSSYFKFHLKKSNYSLHISEKLNTDFISLGIPAKFNESVMKTLVAEDEISEIIQKNVDAIFKNTVFEFPIKKFREKIYHILENDLKSRNVKITKEFQESLNYLTNKCCDSLKKKTVFPFTSEISNTVANIRKIVKISIIILSISATLLLTLIFLMYRKNLKEFFRYVIYSSLTLCFGLICLDFYLIKKYFYKIQCIAVTAKALYYFLTSYLKGIFVAIHCTILAVILVLLLLKFIYGSFCRKM